MPRSDWWRNEYCQTPYLMLAIGSIGPSDDWTNHNNVRLTAARQLPLCPLAAGYFSRYTISGFKVAGKRCDPELQQ